MTHFSNLKLNDDPGRVAALERYDILEAEAPAGFTDVVTLLKSIFAMPYAAITVIDRRHLRTKAAAGMECGDFPRENTPCNVTIRNAGLTVAEDMPADERFRDNPFVTGDAGIRSYIGAPLTSPDGYNIGSLCLFGTEPRVFTEGEKTILQNFAKVVVSQLELRQAATVDRLTGAMTRRSFEDDLGRHVDKGSASWLMFFDIDRFKSINDTFGHHVGDKALRHVADCIRDCLRSEDKYGRIGGEEFAVHAGDATVEEAMKFANELRMAVGTSSFDMIGDRRITISVGVARHTTGDTVEDWFQKADRAMYQAKTTGRNKVVVC